MRCVEGRGCQRADLYLGSPAHAHGSTSDLSARQMYFISFWTFLPSSLSHFTPAFLEYVLHFSLVLSSFFSKPLPRPHSWNWIVFPLIPALKCRIRKVAGAPLCIFLIFSARKELCSKPTIWYHSIYFLMGTPLIRRSHYNFMCSEVVESIL
jgi:hypothetical protein